MEQSDNKVIGWIYLGNGECKCSNCNAEFYYGKRVSIERMGKAFPFCPKCGEIMVEDSTEQEESRSV